MGVRPQADGGGLQPLLVQEARLDDADFRVTAIAPLAVL